ncbi:MAG: sulfate ABC transporter permease subunit CysW [Pseudomonadota bacterium]
MSGGGNLRSIRDNPVKKTGDPLIVRVLLIAAVLFFFITILFLPLALVFTEALKKGFAFYSSALADPAAMSACLLTITVTAIVLPLNTFFGISAAWLIVKFKFPGKTLLNSVLDLPFAVSPVIAGLIFVLSFGHRSPLGRWCIEHGLQIVFSLPGIVLATIFVTFPFVARELIPLMQSLGNEEEEAARIHGAGGFQTFFRITLPNIKWGLVYGMILCNARAIGEFGAVSVVSGHIRGQTNTIPLHVEILYNEYQFTASFAVASVLVLLALLTLVIKNLIEFVSSRDIPR